MLRIPVRRIDPTLPLPSYAHPGDGGIDLLSTTEVKLLPGERVLIPTGIAIAIPEGYAGFVQPRSGLAIKHGVTVLNSPGLIDCGYRDEIRVALVNLDRDSAYAIERGDRIAQLVILAVGHVEWQPVDSLPDAVRGEGGFGSTGR